MGYLMPKASLLKNSSSTTYPFAGDKGVNTFPKGISPKENIIAWLKF